MSLTRQWMQGWTRPDAPAVVHEGGTISWKGLEQRIERAAGWLEQRGIRSGDVVALQLDKEPAFLEVHLAALAVGAITLPMNPAYPPAEVRWLLEDSKAALAVVPDPGGADVPHLDPTALRADLDGATARRLPDGIDLERIGVLCYTSGTTGRPKGARIRQRNLRATVHSLHQAWRWTERDVLLHALPLFHVHGLFVAQHGALCAGATAHWHRRFDPDAILDGIETHRPTIFMGVPTYYHRLLQRSPQTRDLSSVRLFTSGSAGLPAPDWEAWRRATGQGIVERYGMTEVGIVVSNPLEDPKPGSIGLPLPGVRARVVRESDRGLCAPEEVGELEITGDSVFAGYLNRPEATASTLVNGWMRTGDLATHDGAGRLTLVGRQSEMLLRGGLNIYPAEIESVLLERPDISEVAVFGIADADLGERVHAAVVWAAEPKDYRALSEALAERLARYKIPEVFHTVDALPRNAMGKVTRSVLRKRFRAG